jgi:hypothetical protein
MKFLPALTLLLVGLKLTGHIVDWSWWWVWAPIWVPIVVGGGLWLVGKGLLGIAHWLETPEDKKVREAQEALRNFSRHFDRKR